MSSVVFIKYLTCNLRHLYLCQFLAIKVLHKLILYVSFYCWLQSQFFSIHFKGPVMLASSQGGMSIEDVAKENPDAIMTEAVSLYLSYIVEC